jgi:hypothetical protein
MRVVADKLATLAVAQHDVLDADAFGRSAFNRYYYASYLITRHMLMQIDPSWARQGHKTVPEILTTPLAGKARKEVRKAEKAGLLERAEAAGLRDTLNVAVSELSTLLRVAYNVRIIADYEPETKAVKHKNTMLLADESLVRAQNWPNRASAHAKCILRVWRQLGI